MVGRVRRVESGAVPHCGFLTPPVLLLPAADSMGVFLGVLPEAAFFLAACQRDGCRLNISGYLDGRAGVARSGRTEEKREMRLTVFCRAMFVEKRNICECECGARRNGRRGEEGEEKRQSTDSSTEDSRARPVASTFPSEGGGD